MKLEERYKMKNFGLLTLYGQRPKDSSGIGAFSFIITSVWCLFRSKLYPLNF